MSTTLIPASDVRRDAPDARDTSAVLRGVPDLDRRGATHRRRGTTRRGAERPLLPVVGGELGVPLLDGRSVRYANLDIAATAPALVSVAERVAQVLPLSGSVHRGAGLPSQASSALLEAARRTVADALGARVDDHVVFTRNTTDATNLLAAAVPWAAGHVLTLDLEHHANLLPWHRAGRGHRCVAHAPTIDETFARLEAELSTRPVALLAITGASNVTGELLPIDRAVALAHVHGARVLVDAAQLAPHRAIDLSATGVDYLALSGHKLYAPYGSGVLVGRADWLDAAEPYLAGGGAVREVSTSAVDWATGPARHEGGTPNLLGAVAIAAAFEALGALAGRTRETAAGGGGSPATWDARTPGEEPAETAAAGETRSAALDPRIAHEAVLRDVVLDGIADLDGVEALRIWDESEDAIGAVAFAVDGYAPGHVGAYLSAEHGIGVRDGRFCAHPLLARFGRPEGALRASFGVGSRREDAERLVAALTQLVHGGPAFAYCAGPSGWVPEHDSRDVAGWVGPGLAEALGAGARVGGGGGTASPCGG